MRIAVEFQDERIEFDIDGDRLVGHWSGPSHQDGLEPAELARHAFEAPSDFPPLARAVVPGDRVVVPLDPSTPEAPTILRALAEALRPAEIDGITVVSTAPEPPALPEGVTWRVHDPDDRTQIAYLANTQDGRRIYLNRHLTDADIVVPIGTLGFDSAIGYRGPWSTIYPDLADREARLRIRAGGSDDELPDRDRPSPALLESSEVSWLLGCQFQVGVVPGVSGIAKIVSGLESAVRSQGASALDDAWTFRAEDRADVVVAGIGAPGRPTTLDDLAVGLASATRLVRRGGKIIALSRASGEVGAALGRLKGAEGPREALQRLRGQVSEADYPAARRVASALAWADVYLYSGLDSGLVEDLGLVPIDRPSEARKLAGSAPSCLLVSQADRTRAVVVEGGSP